MENELTHGSNLPYPVTRNTMEENVEVKTPGKVEVGKSTTAKESSSREQKPRIVNSETQEKVRKEWDEANKRKEARGEKITEEEKELQRQMIERGTPPVGGASGDGYFENFPVTKFKNSEIVRLAKELKALGENNQATVEELLRINREVNDMAFLGKVPEDEAREFTGTISRIRGARDRGEELEVEEEDDRPLEEVAVQNPAALGEQQAKSPFARFDPEKYAGTSVYKIAQAFKKAIDNGLSMQDVQKALRDAAKNYEEGFDRPAAQSLSNEITSLYQEQKLLSQAATSQRARESSEATGGPDAQAFAHFDVSKFAGTPLEKYAQAFKEAGESGKTLDEIEDLRRQFENEWVDENGQNRYSLDDMQKLREEFQARRNQVQAVEVEKSLRDFQQSQERSSNPKSIQQVCQQIIDSEGSDRWGKDGTFPLLKEDLTLNEANFMRWIRERIMYHHVNNSRDPQLNLPSLIGVDNVFGSTISVFTMEKNRNQYFKDAVTGKVLDNLADQLKTEIWLFGNMRNYDLVYRQYMGQDEELPKFLAQVHSKEELTIGDSLERILTMSDNFTTSGGEKDTKVGDAVRKSYEMYYHISNYDELKKVIGEDSIFFKREGFENAFRILERRVQNEEISTEAIEYINKFYKNGKFDIGTFLTVVNPFNNQNKSEFDVAFSREMVRQAVAEKYGLEYGLDRSTEEREVNGKLRAPERDFHRKNLEYGEAWAWALARFTGAAARNDTGAVGFDAQTKVFKFLDYRLRQSEAGRAGQFGKKNNLGVQRKLIEDFFNGIYIQAPPGKEGEKRTTPFEVFQMLDRKDEEIRAFLKLRGYFEIKEDEREKFISNLSKGDKEIYDGLIKSKMKLAKVRFDQSTQIAYTSNHLGRGFGIFHSTLGGQEAKLHELVKWEPTGPLTGRYVIDNVKLEEEFKEKMIKPFRYAFSTYAQLDFSKDEWVQEGTSKDNEVPKWKKVTRADAFFGPIVTHDLKKEAYKWYKKEQKRKGSKLNGTDLSREEQWKEYVNDTRAGRPMLWKRALMARIAKDIESHRTKYDPKNTSSYMGYEQVELLYKALESIRQVDLADPEDQTDMDIMFKSGKRFLSEDDIKWIRKHSRTGKYSMLAGYLGISIGGGAGSETVKELKDFISGIFK